MPPALMSAALLSLLLDSAAPCDDGCRRQSAADAASDG